MEQYIGLDVSMSKQLAAMAREDQHCRLLMSAPGVGTVTATAFAAAVEDPANFRNSRRGRTGGADPETLPVGRGR